MYAISLPPERRIVKIVKWLFIAFLVLIAVAIIIGFLLPRTYHVERSLSMKAKTADVYALVSNVKSWPEWTIWNEKRDPTLKQEYGATCQGLGASYSWSGKEFGHGTMKLTRADPEKGVAYDLDFEHGQQMSHGEIRLETTGDAVKVTWTNDGDLGMNPVARYFGLMMDGFLGKDFQANLESLKAKVESPGKPH